MVIFYITMTGPMMFEDRRGYAIAERMAAGAMPEVDPDSAASERGVSFDEAAGRFTIPMLGSDVMVTWPGGEVLGPSDQKLSGAMAILALHYLQYRGEPLCGQGWQAYRDMPGARQFASAFEALAENRIADSFGADPAGLLGAAAHIGAAPADTGDASVEIQAFPRVPLMVILWGECEGVGASVRILFRPSAPYYLHSEDLAALGAVVADRLVLLREHPTDDV
jgi:hypothetical protein